MKLILFLLAIPFASFAQKLEENLPPKAFYVDAKPAPIYPTVADTAFKAKAFIAPVKEVMVVGEFSPHWAIIKKNETLYLIPARQLIMYSYYQHTRALDKIANQYKTSVQSDTITSEGYRSIHIGPRGGHYYINSNGNKTYVKHR